MKALQICVAGALLLVLVNPIAAQRPPSAAFQRLQPGQFIRIESGEGASIEGRFERISRDMLSVELAEHPAILISDIEAFRVRGTHALKGLVLGGVFGGVAGAVIAHGLCGLAENSTCNGGSATAAAGLAGAVGVGAVGGLIGLAWPHWRLRYERNPAW